MTTSGVFLFWHMTLLQLYILNMCPTGCNTASKTR